MRKQLVGILAALALALPSAGCIVHTKRPGRSHHHVKNKKHKHRNCHPSQYWDGHRCKHKGKGHGARKHDR